MCIRDRISSVMETRSPATAHIIAKPHANGRVAKESYDEASQCGKKYEKKVLERIFHGYNYHNYKSYKHPRKDNGCRFGMLRITDNYDLVFLALNEFKKKETVEISCSVIFI